jgi:hypothetical protein
LIHHEVVDIIVPIIWLIKELSKLRKILTLIIYCLV